MLQRCIMIFPHFNNMDVINKIRDKYDPLAKHVKPHITLVFPFESDIDYSRLKKHLEATVSSVDPFVLKLSDITPVRSFGNYLFLNILHGRDEIVELHKKLYTGILEEFYPQWLNGSDYNPHMTVGKIDDEEKFKSAVTEASKVKDTFETVVDKVSVEIIDENQHSIIEVEIELG